MIILSRIARSGLSHLSALTRFVQPVNLIAKEVSEMPTLKLKSEKYLLENWWS
jgi:hypothetical protein